MYVKVRVVAGAKKEAFEKLKNGTLKISVKEPAKQNLANRRILTLLAEHFEVPEKSVRILNGHHSPSKMFSIDIKP